MDWKEKIISQVAKAKYYKSIDKSLSDIVKSLLQGDTSFILIYSSSREKYVSIRFSENIRTQTKKIILREYGLLTYKKFNNEKYQE